MAEKTNPLTPTTEPPTPAPTKTWLAKLTPPAIGLACALLVAVGLVATGFLVMPPPHDPVETSAITLSAPDAVAVGEMFYVDVNAANTVTWSDIGAENITQLVGVETKNKDKRYVSKLGATAKNAGTYYIGAMTAPKKGEIVQAWVSVIVLPSSPPQPPPQPLPSSELAKALQAAYKNDLDPGKAAKILKYADVLEGAAPAAVAANAKAVTDKTPLKVKTAGDFVALTHQATDLAVGAGGILGVRKAVGAYLVTVLPREANTPANDAYFARVASEHGFVALTLRGIR